MDDDEWVIVKASHEGSQTWFILYEGNSLSDAFKRIREVQRDLITQIEFPERRIRGRKERV